MFKALPFAGGFWALIRADNFYFILDSTELTIHPEEESTHLINFTENQIKLNSGTRWTIIDSSKQNYGTKRVLYTGIFT